MLNFKYYRKVKFIESFRASPGLVGYGSLRFGIYIPWRDNGSLDQEISISIILLNISSVLRPAINRLPLKFDALWNPRISE